MKRFRTFAEEMEAILVRTITELDEADRRQTIFQNQPKEYDRYTVEPHGEGHSKAGEHPEFSDRQQAHKHAQRLAGQGQVASVHGHDHKGSSVLKVYDPKEPQRWSAPAM